MQAPFKRFVVLLTLLAAATTVVAALWRLRASAPATPQVRCIWVTRFDYSTPEDVRRIIGNVADAGFTDCFFQIRGNGTAFYRSDREPWAFELSGGKVETLGTDPGWDPLQLAIECAHARGVRLHAYMNVLPGWKGTHDPPARAGQLWTAHPDWFMVDSLGCKMLPTAGWYAFLNPVLPEVRAHLRGVAADLCRYDIDGLHLDYIRYPHDYHLVAAQRYPAASEEELMRHSDFSYDPESLAQLYEKHGWEVGKAQVAAFRCDSVTRVVRDLSYTMQLAKPDGCLLSASVLGNPVVGRYSAYQDSGGWVRTRLVDWVVQMNYGTRSFDGYLKEMRRAAGRRGFRSSVVVGINCKNTADEILQQLETVRQSGCRGFALFAYSLLFDDQHRPSEKGRVLLPELRRLAGDTAGEP